MLPGEVRLMLAQYVKAYIKRNKNEKPRPMLKQNARLRKPRATLP
jgi:hypothetical protein